MPHTNANWFLEELKAQENTPERFCMLIEKIITCRWEVSENNKNKIFEKLLENNNIIQPNIEWTTEETINEDNTTEKSETENNDEQINLTLNKLIHTSWVNALISWENIPFSDSCTIIYGLNWQWKSGYFRILNELAGWSEKCEIKPNIYKEQEEPLNVSIEYTLNKEGKTYNYIDKNLRWIFPFDNIKVFDHNYMKHFLNDREIQWNIEPLWLHLFEKTTKIIEEFENKIKILKEDKQDKIRTLNAIKANIHNDEIKVLLEKTDISDDEYKEIENIQNLTDEQEKNLEELKDKLDKINKSNKQDTLELTKTRKSSLETIKSNIEHLSKINDYIEEVKTNLTNYNQALSQRDTKKKELSVLQKIPWNDTKEWQLFIESGKKYWEEVREHKHNTQEKCIYCQQPLLGDSLDIIKAYSTYLSDTSQTKVETEKQNTDIIKENIWKIIIDFTIPDFLEQEEKNTIEAIKTEATELSNKLSMSIDENKIDEWLKKIETDDIIKKIEEKIAKHQNDIQDFSKDKIEQESQIKRLEEQTHKLEDQKTVYTNKKTIKKYFSLHKEIKKLDDLSFSSIKTKISRKSSEATENLITQNLIDKFNEILPKIRNDLNHIELKKATTTWGVPHIKLCIKNKAENIDVILSEWEKKAVCLALFFAEIVREWNSIPIILDDPVTSLDHKLSDNIANLIIETWLKNQTIIFTHNQTFLESLIYWWNNTKKQSHVCKNYNMCNTEWKHILIYKIEKQNSLKTWKVFNYNELCLNYFIKKAESELKSSWANATVCHNLKSAIEYYIDEKIFNNQIPIKFSKNKDNKNWDQLKQISNAWYNTDNLKIHRDNLSSRGTHLSYQQQNNPLDTNDLNQIITYLKQ